MRNNRCEMIVDDLIRNYANSTRHGYCLFIGDLPEHEQNKLMTELFYQDDSFDCMYDEFETMKTLVANFLSKEDREARTDLAEGMREIMFGYYKPIMQKLIDDRMEYVSAEDLEHFGYVPAQCNQTGETLWR